jgi:hypothetical protein
VEFFQQHLPEKCKSIADLRSTNARDMARLAKSSKMKLDTKTSRSVLEYVPPARAERLLTLSLLV